MKTQQHRPEGNHLVRFSLRPEACQKRTLLRPSLRHFEEKTRFFLSFLPQHQGQREQKEQSNVQHPNLWKVRKQRGEKNKRFTWNDESRKVELLLQEGQSVVVLACKHFVDSVVRAHDAQHSGVHCSSKRLQIQKLSVCKKEWSKDATKRELANEYEKSNFSHNRFSFLHTFVNLDGNVESRRVEIVVDVVFGARHHALVLNGAHTRLRHSTRQKRIFAQTLETSTWKGEMKREEWIYTKFFIEQKQQLKKSTLRDSFKKKQQRTNEEKEIQKTLHRKSFSVGHWYSKRTRFFQNQKNPKKKNSFNKTLPSQAIIAIQKKFPQSRFFEKKKKNTIPKKKTKTSIFLKQRSPPSATLAKFIMGPSKTPVPFALCCLPIAPANSPNKFKSHDCAIVSALGHAVALTVFLSKEEKNKNKRYILHSVRHSLRTVFHLEARNAKSRIWSRLTHVRTFRSVQHRNLFLERHALQQRLGATLRRRAKPDAKQNPQQQHRKYWWRQEKKKKKCEGLFFLLSSPLF